MHIYKYLNIPLLENDKEKLVKKNVKYLCFILLIYKYVELIDGSIRKKEKKINQSNALKQMHLVHHSLSLISGYS